MGNATYEKWFAKLSEAELDQAEQIEKDLQAACAQGWSGATAEAFVRGVMLLKKKIPDLAVGNVADMALREGVIAMVAKVYGVDRNGVREPSGKRGETPAVRGLPRRVRGV
jgi:hypothetical protein